MYKMIGKLSKLINHYNYFKERIEYIVNSNCQNIKNCNIQICDKFRYTLFLI